MGSMSELLRRPGTYIISAVLLISLVVWQSLDDFGPKYQGHSPAWWLDNTTMGSASDSTGVDPAFFSQVAAFRAMGPSAVRYLGQAYAKRRLLHWNKMEDRQATAGEILYCLGSNAAPALPSLVHLYQHPFPEWAGVMGPPYILAHIPQEKLKPLLPDVIEDLKSADTPRLAADAALLSAIGPAAKPALPRLLSLASKSGDPILELNTAIALWNIDGRTNLLIDCVSKALARRRNNAWILNSVRERCAPYPECLTTILEAALRHPEPLVRRLARQLLQENHRERLIATAQDLNRQRDQMVQEHLRLIQSADGRDCENAWPGLCFQDSRPFDIRPLLNSLKRDPSALHWLRYLGPNAQPAVPILVGLLQTQPAEVVCDDLAAIGPKANGAVPALRKLLTTRQVEPMRLEIARALVSIDSHETNALAVVRDALSKPRLPQEADRPWQRFSLGVCLWKAGIATKPPVEELIAANSNWTDTSPDGWQQEGRTAICGILADIGPEAKRAIPMLEERLETDPQDIDAALALWRIDREAARQMGLPGLFLICPEKY